MENVISKEAMDVLKRTFECEGRHSSQESSTLYLIQGKDDVPVAGFIAFIDTAIMDGKIMSFVLEDLPDYARQLWNEAVRGCKGQNQPVYQSTPTL